MTPSSLPMWTMLATLAITSAHLASADARTPPAGTRGDPVVASLLREAHALDTARRWAELDSVAALAFDQASRQRPPDSAAMSTSLYLRALSRFGRAQFADTLLGVFLGRGIALQRGLSRSDPVALVSFLDLQGRTLIERDRADSALSLLAEARSLCRPGVADWDSLLARSWITTGRAQRRLERYEQALAAFDSARALRERRSGPRSVGVAEALAELGAVHGRMGRIEEAVAALEQAVDLMVQTSGGETPQIVRPLTDLAGVQREAGDVARSIETLERALAVTVRSSGPDSPRLIPQIFSIGLRLVELGDDEGAFQVFSTLLPRAEAALGAGNTRTEYARLLTGASALEIGDTAAAARHLEKARAELLSRPVDPNHMMNQLEAYYAGLLMARGDAAGARRATAEGLARERATERPNPMVITLLCQRMVGVQIALADRGGLDSTMAAMDRELGSLSQSNVLIFSDYLYLRARGEHWLGRRDRATEFALRAEALHRERLATNARALPETRALQLSAQTGDALELLIRLSDGGEPTIATAWDRLARWRGLVTAELARRRLPHSATADTALVAAHAQWVAALRRAARLEVAAAGEPNPALDRSRADAEAWSQRFARLAAARGLIRDTAEASLARVRDALAGDEALISVFTLAAGTDTARAIAFATRGPRGALRRLDLGPARELSRAIAEWRSALGKAPRPGRERADERACRALGARVRERSWDRLAPLVAGARRVVLVADGALADLPWQALPLGSDRYLVESGLVVETPGAERELLDARAREGRGLLAMGDPDFGPGAGVAGLCADAPAVALAPLPGARAEVNDIARAWNESHASDPAELRVGTDVSEPLFKREAPGRQVVHVATHGVVWSDRCGPVLAGLRGVGGIALLASQRSPAQAPPNSPPHPASSSPWSGRQVWLAMAGANDARVGADDEDDGLLTADEVVTLDLSDVDWVVLSACQSGVGNPWPLEGSLGMRRAFRLAGARTVIASHWPIADTSTREWMRGLYAAQAAGERNAARAMRAATLGVLEARRREARTTHPFYWAAFSASGR